VYFFPFIFVLLCIIILLITSSIAHSAKRQYITYSEADFEVFCPTGATHCTDGGEIWHGGVDLSSVLISPPSVQGYSTAKTEVFYSEHTKIRNINAPRVCIPCAIFTNLQSFYLVSGCVNKIWIDLFKGLWSYRGFKLRGLCFPQIFSTP